MDRLIGLDALRGVYADVHARQPAGAVDGESFSSDVLDVLKIRTEVADTDLARIPATGPLIVAANHPLGGADGLLLLDIVRRRRTDLRLLANSWLAKLPELAPVVIPVDVFDTKSAANASALRTAARWVRDGGCLLTFPAGEVSRLRLRRREVSDGPWSPSLSVLSRLGNAPVVPLHFADANSWLFQTLGQLHAVLRTVMLPRELLRKRDSTVRVRIGTPIDPPRLARFASDLEASAFVRACSYLLAAPPLAAAVAAASTTPRAGARAMQPLIAPVDPAAMAAEVAALPPERTLAKVGAMRVLIASAAEIPCTLREIGRLREATFRAVGEGTGAASDLDEFDLTYRHLFVFDEASPVPGCQGGAVVGAYRLGLTDELPTEPGSGAAGAGVPRLYTATLFRYRPDQLARLVPAIELGRSFVRAEYQRQHSPLLLLWQGIGRFVVAHPQYRLLFGTASISDSYPSMTRKLLVRFINRSFGPGEFARVATPSIPPKFARARDGETALAADHLHDLDDADRLVASLDPQGRGLPTLLRQYLRLGAKMIGFNIDPAFGDALDGLIVVDLITAPSKLVSRYMGKEGYAAFCAHHAGK